jgi:hypothetical protein
MWRVLGVMPIIGSSLRVRKEEREAHCSIKEDMKLS